MSNLDITNIKFIPDGIGHFISDNFLEIPTYQRPYAWEEKHIQELLEDIHSSMPNEYFIGSIVVTPNTGKTAWTIVDGQQRIATIFLLYAAIRDYLSQNNDQDNADEFERDFICRKDRRTRETIQKLKLGEDDNNFLLKKIIEKQAVDPKKSSHKRILNAYKIAFNFIKEKVRLSGNVDYIHNLDDFVQKDLKIVIVQVPDSVNAFTVFETLNDRGLDLSKTDLIKNYLFNKSESRLTEAQDKWSKISGAIEASLSEEELVAFVRYYWSSKYGLTREKDLFSEIKNKITNSNLCITFLDELERSTKKYIALTNSNHELWNEHSHTTREYIKVFNNLRIKQNRPLLLAILSQFDTTNVEKSLKLVLSWTIRNLITNSIPLGTLEREFSNQAKKINNGEINNALNLKASISDLVPSDDTFKDSFSVATVSKNFIAAYYLRKLEEFYRNSEELTPIENFDRVNIEHILPQNPTNLGNDWPNFDEESYKGWCKRIGNLTLINKNVNSGIQDGSFDNKKDEYRSSDIKITQDLFNQTEWSPETITNRQKNFAEKAVLIWNLDIN